MNRNAQTAAISWVILSALLAAVLVGCGGESTPRIPAPPPFVPATVVVQLGEQGGATTLISTQAGGWTHNGEPFTSGSTVRGENAATYQLTLSGGSWSAAFVSPDPARVQLGTSGDEATLQLQEDGTYQLGGAAVQSGDVVNASNGNQYTLTLDASGNWSAAFLAPDPRRIVLGASGDSVVVEMREDRNYWLDDTPLSSGRVIEAANGSRYTLTFGPDGMWRAVFVQPPPQRVALGSSGRTVLVDMLENGTYQIEGSHLWAGEVREIGDFKYRFSLGSDGRWTATYEADPVTVRLGAHGGTISLALQENGGWALGGEVIRTGHLVQGTNGHTYRLTLAGGTWRAEPQPMTIQVALRGTGGSIVLTNVEDGSYLYEGTPVSSGDVISVGQTNYRLTQLSDGSWRAALTSAAPIPSPGDPLTRDSLATYVGISPRARLTDDGSTASRSGSIFELNDLEYSVNALFTHGQHDREITFAEEARALITGELSDLEALIVLAETSSGLDSTIEQRWDRITGHLDRLFPNEGDDILGINAPRQRNGRIDYEEVVEDIQDVLAALENSRSFQLALEDGIFSDARSVDPDESDDTFFAVRSVTRLGFGWTSATRYGAYTKLQRSRISDELTFASGTEGIGAFAYSPWETTRTRELPSSGQAYYFGETVAASRESRQVIYTGDIELRVQFASRQVNALVTDLQDASGGAWRFSLRDVDSIQLPVARLDSTIGSFEPLSSGTARVSFRPIAISLSARSLASEFEGRFVGRDNDAGESAIGTWSVSSGGSVILAGGFGADLESGPTRPPPTTRPPVDPSGDLGEEAATYVGARPDQNGDIDIAALDADGDPIELPASELYTNRGTVVEGQRLFDKTRQVLDDNLKLLDIYINLLGSQDSQARRDVWAAANQSLRDNIFSRSNVLGAGYPTGRDRDEDAVELLQEAYYALAGASSFRDAVNDGGIFENILTQSRLDSGDYDFEDIATALEYEVLAKYDHTDLTRFGVWAKEVRQDALSPRTLASGNERGDAFAYSPIEQTVYFTSDPNFPRGFTSTYLGRTVAVDRGLDGPTFYDGDVQVSVSWRSSSPQSSDVTMVIENLIGIDDGAPLLVGQFEISSLIISGGRVVLDSSNRIGLAGTSSARVRYVDPSRSERFSGTVTLDGKFVSYTAAGPGAVFGTWDWGDVIGAFGAEVLP